MQLETYKRQEITLKSLYFNLPTKHSSIGGILLVFWNIDCDAGKARRCHIHSYFFLEFLLLLIVVNQPHSTSHACLQWLVSFSICWSLKCIHLFTYFQYCQKLQWGKTLSKPLYVELLLWKTWHLYINSSRCRTIYYSHILKFLESSPKLYH